MNRTELAYFLVRRAEEEYGPPLDEGQTLIYRAEPRFPWFGEHFDLAPGWRVRIDAVEYDGADSKDHDPCDNHYHYHIDGLREHGALTTTELLAWFDPEIPNDFDVIGEQIVAYIDELLTQSSAALN